jgi:thioredoxin reductase
MMIMVELIAINMNVLKQEFDVLIVGGSYAGLSAAMTLGRSIRKVLLVDSGRPCNAQTPYSHNFITQDGVKPADIADKAKAQVLQYPTVQILEDKVVEVSGINGDFRVLTERGMRIQAKKILFATGIKDIMPDIPGFSECWGISAIHCPYCHGYEYRGMNTGILINGEMAADFAHFINNWTDKLTVFSNGPALITPENLNSLEKAGIHLVETEIAEIVHQNGQMQHIRFKDGSTRDLDALYARVPFEQHCQIPEQMGCEMTAEGHIKVDEMKKTNVPGIYAAGDNTTMMRMVSVSAAAGALTAAMMNHELVSDHRPKY